MVSKYACYLEAQPDHLTPAWLIPRKRTEAEPGDLYLSAGIRQQARTLWVPDPATCVQNAFVLSEAAWRALAAWRENGSLPPSGLIDRLRDAGIVTTADDHSAVLASWRRTISVCRTSLENGFTPVRGLIHPYQLSALRCYFRRLIRCRYLPFGDPQCRKRYVAHNEMVASHFHRQLTSAVGALLGKRVKPSYCYFISYQEGAELTEHVDRAQCKYTLALCLDFSPEPVRGSPWPLQLKLPTETVVVHQALGDALLYEGRRIPHFRTRLAGGCTSTSILFHYVDHDFAGPLS